MRERLGRVLILDTDPDTLLVLQHVLEGAELDVTITWDGSEACQLLGVASFDLFLIGDHPPELDAAAILNDFSFRGVCPPVLILMDVVGEKNTEYFRTLGAIGTLRKRDTRAILEQVTIALTSKPRAAKTASIPARSWRAAS